MSKARKSTAEKKAEAKAAVETLHAEFAKITTTEEFTQWLRWTSRFRSYSPQNTMWMLCQWSQRRKAREIVRLIETFLVGGPVSPSLPELSLPAGASKWKELGGYINKGEKGLSVLAPVVITMRDEPVDPATGKHPTKCIGFQLKSRTFDIAQINGVEEVPQPAECKILNGSNDDDQAVFDALVKVAQEIPTSRGVGFHVDITDAGLGQANGSCNYSTSTITIKESNPLPQQVKTLVHEIGHALLHDPANKLGGGFLDRQQVEVEAESVAYTVASMLGRDTSDYSLGYVIHWSKGDGALMARTMERVVDTAYRIVDALEGKGVRKPKCKPVPDPEIDEGGAESHQEAA